MNVDGSNLHQVSHGNNSQGASFSPDGKRVAFTDNNDCDYQPRSGNYRVPHNLLNFMIGFLSTNSLKSLLIYETSGKNAYISFN